MTTMTATTGHVRVANITHQPTRPVPVDHFMPSCAGCGQDLDSAAVVVELPSGRTGWCVLCVSRAGD